MRRLRGATRWGWMVAIAVVAVGAFVTSTQVCLRTGFSHGLWLNECPDGELRQSLNVWAPALSRGAKSPVTVRTSALYTTGAADERRSEPLGDFLPSLALVSPAGAETPLKPEKSWARSGDGLTADVELPKVPDGDYLLRTQVKSSLGESKLDLPLPLYAPARVHVLTDRPLYEPGNVMKFRAVVLRSDDLSPLDHRPGTWRVEDPQGTVLLEEKAPAGAWGVVTGSFPLDRGAESGAWKVTWASGAASDTRVVTVKPFTLPRFRVEAGPERPFYRRNERPTLKGEVRYASGAPVVNAAIAVEWQVSGDWPPPTAWVEGTALPKGATTSAAGAFTLQLPAVPEDLQGQAHLTARLAAVDPSGDRVEGSADVLLSQDPIAVTAVSELQDGLVEGFNNRLYLRATTADGRLLEGVTLNVKRLWEPTDKGADAVVDEDGVASLQIDPGPAVNVVIPAMPFRVPAKVKPVVRDEVHDYLASEDGSEASLADRLTFDRVEAKLAPCARYVNGPGDGAFGVLVAASGAVLGLGGTNGPIGECVAKVLDGLRFEAGRERLFRVTYSFSDEDLPSLSTASVQGVPETPPQVEAALNAALPEARDCLPATVASGPLPQQLLWRWDPKKNGLEVTWAPDPNGQRLAEGALACLQQRLGRLKLPKRPASETDDPDQAPPGAVGVARLTVTAPASYEAERPQETVLTGYEFLVTAKKKGETLGTTRLLLHPGAVPQIRLRANKQVLSHGEELRVELLRGPDFTGELPEKLELTQGYRTFETAVDKEKHLAAWRLPDDVEGWAAVSWGGAQLFLFVQPRARLAVTVKAEKPRYAPGQLAHLSLETTVGGAGAPAAVGLFGVDQSLAQLTALPGADELAKLRPQATGAAAFGSLDAQALSLGRVRGANAAAATLLRVAALPPAPEVESAVSAAGETAFDPNETLVDRFYVVLQELHVQTREWEGSAPAGEKMTPAKLAELWRKAVDAVERRKDSARDAWGRTLRLHRLPADLLALTDPRAVVVDGTRLPEDVQNWPQWVAKEKP